MAKNTKGGLGRGLDSLLGGYEAAMEPARSAAPAQKEQLATPAPTQSPNIDPVEKRITPARTADREVIREEDLPQEDRAVLNGEKKESSSVKTTQETVKPTIAVKDVVAKKELIEENDGVTIMGVVERVPGASSAPRPASGQSPAAAKATPATASTKTASVTTVASASSASRAATNAAANAIESIEGEPMTIEAAIDQVKPKSHAFSNACDARNFVSLSLS